MTTDSFSFKKGAELPLREIVLDGNDLVNLDDVDTDGITFVYRRIGVDEKLTIPATVSSSSTRTIIVDFAGIDIAIARYQWHVEVVIGGKPMYFPEKSFYSFRVTENID